MDRSGLARELDQWMTEGHFYFQETGQHQSKRPLLKSYLVEANAPEVGEDPDGVMKFFSRLELPIEVHIRSADDPTLQTVTVGKRRTVFFLDTLDPRYWIFHSIDSASEADQSIRSLVGRTRYLDAFWLPSDQLQQWIGDLGTPRALTAKFSVPSLLYRESFSEDTFHQNAGSGDTAFHDSLYLRLGSRGDARNPWQQLESADTALSPMLALWSAKIARHDDDSFIQVVTDVTAAGKLTTRGNSFRLHEEILAGIRNQYRRMIETWESMYRLSWSQGENGIRPSGTTALLRLSEEMSEGQLEGLVSRLFNCAEPFRLFGIPIREGDGRFVIRGIDLHTGDKIDFEITREFVRAYLYPTTCGNVLARLLTNLQHFVDARVSLESP